PHIYSNGFPSLVRSMMRSRLARPLVEQLLRSEMGEVTLKRAFYDHKSIPPVVLSNYQRILHTRNWHDGWLEMARLKEEPASDLVSTNYSRLICPIIIMHGDHDKIVAFDESL